VSTEHLSKLHGMPIVSSGEIEQGSGVNQGTVKNQVPPHEQQDKQQEQAALGTMGQDVLHHIYWL